MIPLEEQEAMLKEIARTQDPAMLTIAADLINQLAGFEYVTKEAVDNLA